MTDTAVSLLRLPHTGLRVPDRSLSLTNYQARPTDDGAWFQATVNIGGTRVGIVENAGLGGPTCLTAEPDHPVHGDVFAVLDEYARHCRTEEGDPVTNLEELLDELVAEHEWALKVADASHKGRLLLRLMAFVLVGDDNLPIAGFPPRPDTSTTSAIPDSAAHWTKLGVALNTTSALAPGDLGWWQAWHADHWKDLTPRPVLAAADLYN